MSTLGQAFSVGGGGATETTLLDVDVQVTAINNKTPTVGRKAAAASSPVALSNEDAQYLIDQQTLTGLLNDPAPASDTASASLNGRLQRVAQRLTTLIGQMPASIVSTVNSSVAALGSSATFTGTSESCLLYSVVEVSVFADQAGTLNFQQSSNGTNWDFVDSYTIPANTGKVFSFACASSFYRVVYVNGATLQTAFRLQSILKYIAPKPSAHSLADTITLQNDAELTIAQIRATNGANSVPVNADTSGNLIESVADVVASGTITTQNLVPAGTATANSAVLSGQLNGHGMISVQVTGTYTGALSLQTTLDGTTWVTSAGGVFFSRATGAMLGATITSALQGVFEIDCSGSSQIRITGLAAMTGTATITMRATRAGSKLVTLDTAIPAGSAIIGALSANQSSNVSQINAVTPLMGNGVTGTGSLRVTVASDNTAIPVGLTAPTAVTVKQAAVALGTTAIRATTDGAAVTAGRRRLSIRPDPDSVAKFYYGSSTVTSSGATRGIPIFPGESVDIVNDAGDYFIISDTAAQTVFIVEQE